MDTSTFVLNKLRQDITEHELQLKAVIQVLIWHNTVWYQLFNPLFQDIELCSGPLAELQALNSIGRSKISSLRKFIDSLSDIAKEENDPALLKEVVLLREKLAT